MLKKRIRKLDKEQKKQVHKWNPDGSQKEKDSVRTSTAMSGGSRWRTVQGRNEDEQNYGEDFPDPDKDLTELFK